MLDRLHSLFMNPTARRVLLALRVPLGLACIALLFLNLDPRWLWVGAGISLVGELIQLWCFANLSKKEFVAATGPYALVRNPMYLGRFLIGFGALMLLDSWPVLAAYTLIYVLYMVNRVRREEAILAPRLGASYAEYLASVRRFVPGKPFRGNPVWTWNWQQFHKNHGGWNALATVAFWVVAVVAIQLRGVS